MKRASLFHLILTALFAALILVFTAYIGHIPLPGTNGFIHFGDALIFLAASLLPKPYAAAAGLLGGGLADLLTFPSTTVPTIVIKGCVALCFSAKPEKILCPRNTLALLPAGLVTLGGYYAAGGILFGWTAALAQGLTANAVQVLGSSAIYILLGLATDKIQLKHKMKQWSKP